MALTKISRSLLDTGISDSSDATAITIDSSENVTITGDLTVTGGQINTGNTAGDHSELGTDVSGHTFIDASTAGGVIKFKLAGTDKLQLSGNNLHLNGGTDARIQLGSGGAGANSTSNDTVHIRGDGTSMKLMAASGGEYLFEINGTQVANLDTDGLKFGTDSAAANALDDYEEGTWTPATNGTGVGITTYTATYTKIGDLVMYRCYIQIGVNSAGDAATISGLPFTNGGSNFWCAGSIWENNAKQPYVLVSDGGADTVQLRQNSNGSSHPYSDFSNTQIIITGTYKTLQ